VWLPRTCLRRSRSVSTNRQRKGDNTPWPYRHDSPEGRYQYLKEERKLRDEEANDDVNDLKGRDSYYEEQQRLEDERYDRQKDEARRQEDRDEQRERDREYERERERERYEEERRRR